VDMNHRFPVRARRGEELRFLLITPRATAPVVNPTTGPPDPASQVSPPAR
jgi:hypothetical protein